MHSVARKKCTHSWTNTFDASICTHQTPSQDFRHSVGTPLLPSKPAEMKNIKPLPNGHTIIYTLSNTTNEVISKSRPKPSTRLISNRGYRLSGDFEIKTFKFRHSKCISYGRRRIVVKIRITKMYEWNLQTQMIILTISNLLKELPSKVIESFGRAVGTPLIHKQWHI